jgi:hypothetical protein
MAQKIEEIKVDGHISYIVEGFEGIILNRHWNSIFDEVGI